MKKKITTVFITFIITAIICSIAAFIVVTEVYQPNYIGQTGTETIEVTDANGSVTGKNITSYVFLGANSKLYEDEDATTSYGIFLDTFEDGELAELIDNNQFPYQQE